jgi:glyoxylase-like metal-dependent hydrolase (beta-lactamase superfamily II)
LAAHVLEIPVLEGSAYWGSQYGINGDLSPEIEIYLHEGDCIEFGTSKIEVIFVPGHSPGHIAFINHDEKFIINGDVLFEGSFGRYDLPGGDLKKLAQSIKKKLFILPDDYKVYAGHMGETTIGKEKKSQSYITDSIIKRNSNESEQIKRIISNILSTFPWGS